MRIVLSIACTLVALAAPGSASAVVGGKTAQSGAYPTWSRSGMPWPESGTLIAASVVLTAAHCVAGLEAAPCASCSIGMRSAASFAVAEASGDATRETAVYVHPKFTPEGMRYDAALLLLAHPATGLRAVAMAPPRRRPARAERSRVGHDEGARRDVARPPPQRVARGRSGALVRRRLLRPEHDLCGRSRARHCSGDSGGPLVATLDGKLELVGDHELRHRLRGAGCNRACTRASPSIRAWAPSRSPARPPPRPGSPS